MVTLQINFSVVFFFTAKFKLIPMTISLSARSGILSAWTLSSLALSRAFKILHVLNAFLTISAGISAHERFIQGKTKLLHSTFFFPAGANSKGPSCHHPAKLLLPDVVLEWFVEAFVQWLRGWSQATWNYCHIDLTLP